jgi:hypothetical protein
MAKGVNTRCDPMNATRSPAEERPQLAAEHSRVYEGYRRDVRSIWEELADGGKVERRFTLIMGSLKLSWGDVVRQPAFSRPWINKNSFESVPWTREPGEEVR